MSVRHCRRVSGIRFPLSRRSLSLDERVRRNTVPTRTRKSTPLSRWASDRDHYDRKPLAWYVSPKWRRESGR